MKSSTSTEVAICLLLFFDVVWLRQCNSALGSYNAAQYYGCMLHSLTSLLAKSIGILVSHISTMLLVIQFMQFHICTIYGDSNQTYGSTQDSPYQSAYQGNGAAIDAWLISSAVLIMHMRTNGHAVDIISAITVTMLCCVGFGIVNYGSILTLATFPKKNAESVAH